MRRLCCWRSGKWRGYVHCSYVCITSNNYPALWPHDYSHESTLRPHADVSGVPVPLPPLTTPNDSNSHATGWPHVHALYPSVRFEVVTLHQHLRPVPSHLGLCQHPWTLPLALLHRTQWRTQYRSQQAPCAARTATYEHIRTAGQGDRRNFPSLQGQEHAAKISTFSSQS